MISLLIVCFVDYFFDLLRSLSIDTDPALEWLPF